MSLKHLQNALKYLECMDLNRATEQVRLFLIDENRLRAERSRNIALLDPEKSRKAHLILLLEEATKRKRFEVRHQLSKIKRPALDTLLHREEKEKCQATLISTNVL
jgi:hypothetical protein